MPAQISAEWVSQIQAFADSEELPFEAALEKVFWKGMFVVFSEIVSEQIPEALRGLVVIDYHTVHGWARFKGTRLPLQILVGSLVEDPTGNNFRRGYGSAVSDRDIETVKSWLATPPP